MDKEHLEGFKVRLLEEKTRLETELEQLAKDAQDNAIDQALEGVASSMADVATDVMDQARIMEERNEARELLKRVIHALDRIENGSYGISEVSGRAIPLERLEALPWATTLVDEGK
jgi:RNA polymerase-binding protein DksA